MSQPMRSAFSNNTLLKWYLEAGKEDSQECKDELTVLETPRLARRDN